VTKSIARVLSKSQIDMLAEHGEERTAEVGDVLFEVGDETYPFIAIREGEAKILDGSGREIVRHGTSGFLGEMNLLSGQTVYLTAVVTEPMSYVAVDRETLRQLLFDDGALSDLLLSAFVQRRELLQAEGVGIEIVGSARDHGTRDLVEFARRMRLPHSWRDPDEDPDAATLIAGIDAAELPLVLLPGGSELRAPSNGELSRALGIGLELAPREEVDLLIVGGGPAGLGAAVYGASEGLNTLVVESNVLGGQAGTSRRIENYLGFPSGISGTELISRAIVQARKFSARTATPYKALSLEPGGEGDHIVKLEDGHEVAAKAVLLSTGAEYRKLPVDNLEEYEGLSVFYAAGPPEAQLCGAARVGVVGGGNSAAQAAVWLAKGGALVTLLHRRGDLAETMSAYLIDELDRYGVAVRDRSEIRELRGAEGHLDSVELTDGTELPFQFLFLFLGASPCTGWLGDQIARDEKGFVLTGADAGAEGLLETSVSGVYAAGDVRAGSIKRCATAVGEGATVVRFVHEHMEKLREEYREADASAAPVGAEPGRG
jgi:thioredoxin reductase (NADPH)